MQEEYRNKGVVVVMVSIDEEDFLVPLYLKKHPASAQVLLPKEARNKTQNAYGVNGIPANFFLDRQGVVRFYQVGFGTGAEKRFRETLDSLLKSSASPAP